MRSIGIIFRRELGAYLRSPLGYVIAAMALLVCGILFQTRALDDKERLSAEVLMRFFEYCSGVTMVAAILLSLRLLAEERQLQTIMLLKTSPVRDVEVVLGKFLAAFVFLSGVVLLSFYMPLLIKWRGKITMSQVMVGYLGLILLGGASLAIGTFASSVTKHQLIAGVLGAAMLIIMLILFPLGKQMSAPFDTVFAELDLWYIHFRDGFMKGIVNLKDIIYYVAVTYFFLLLATKTTEAKRWH